MFDVFAIIGMGITAGFACLGVYVALGFIHWLVTADHSPQVFKPNRDKIETFTCQVCGCKTHIIEHEPDPIEDYRSYM